MAQPKYHRVLLKISGEALAGDAHRGWISTSSAASAMSSEQCRELGVQIGIVVGGGNFWRGLKDGGARMERTRADHMGMLATVINALAIADCLEQRDVPVRVQTAIEMDRIAEPYIRSKAIRHLEKGRVVVFGCGTGNPFFSQRTPAPPCGRSRSGPTRSCLPRISTASTPPTRPRIRLPSNTTKSPMMRSSSSILLLWIAPRLPFLWIITCPSLSLP